jgi:hypothetical protein
MGLDEIWSKGSDIRSDGFKWVRYEIGQDHITRSKIRWDQMRLGHSNGSEMRCDKMR